MGTKRDLEAIEARRLEGLKLLKRKVSQSEVARRVGVTRQTVHIWARRLEEVSGAVGKLRARSLGRPTKLDREQLEGLRAILLAGALTAGFPTELWTIKRVRAVDQFRTRPLNSGHEGQPQSFNDVLFTSDYLPQA